MEIGSEFWWSGEKEQSFNVRRKDLRYIFPRGMKNMKLTSSGRGAISYILKNNEFKSKRALLPVYICESVILPFEENNFEIIFYQVNKDLSPNLENITLDFDIFFHLGYYGFKTNMIENLPINISEKNVIEDITHSMFSKNDFEDINDFQIGSIRKWFGIPSGGIVMGTKLPDMNLSESSNNFIPIRKKGLVEKDKYINQVVENKDYLDILNEAEKNLDNDVDAYKIDQESMDIIKYFNYDQMIRKRRENYQVLLNGISQTNRVKFIFEKLPDTVCPMFFPVYVDERDSLRRFLIKNKIYCPVHWPIPPQVKESLDDTTTYIYNHILSIPCDQRYGQSEMERIVKVVNEWLSQ